MDRAGKRLSRLTCAAAAAGSALAFASPARAGLVAPDAPHSPNTDDLQVAYWIVLILVAAIVVAVNGALLVGARRYRARRGVEPERTRGNPRAQLMAGGIGAALMAVTLVLGILSAAAARDIEPSGPQGLRAASLTTAQLGIEPPRGKGQSLRVKVTGQQWLWRYEYPDGPFSYYELVAPVDTTVLLDVTSTDVIHTWWVPELTPQVDAVPGQTGRTWFKADREGVYEGQSATFSGAGYATMRARVRVVSPAQYEAWVDRQGRDIKAAQDAVRRQVAPEEEGA